MSRISILGCPFCLEKLIKQKEIIVDSFENAVLKILNDNGIEVLQERRKFLSLLSDVAYEYRKEVKILSNACDIKTFYALFDLSKLKINDASIELKRIEKRLIDDEGISAVWAKRICKAFFDGLFPRENIKDNLKEKSANINVSLKNPNIRNDIPLLDFPNELKGKTLEITGKYVIIDNNSLYQKTPLSIDKNNANLYLRGTSPTEKYVRVGNNDLYEQNSFYLPKDVTFLYLDANILPPNTFIKCEGLKTVLLSKNVVSVFPNAFIECNNIEFVIVEDGSQRRHIDDKTLWPVSKVRFFCSVKDHSLRSRFTNAICYDFGVSNDEKRKVEEIIRYFKQL